MTLTRSALYKREHPEQAREYRQRSSRKQSKWVQRNIVAWDGEGCNLGERQLYVLLANSKGDSIVNRGGLTTIDCLEFLTTQSQADEIGVIFGGSYDANMWIADLPRQRLEELWTTGKTHFAHFYIRYQWRKCFMVKNDETGATATIWDVLGFFQTSFVQTLKLWLPDVDVTAIEQMKMDRPDFDLRVLDAIKSYNAEECRLLVRVCRELFAAFDTAGITLNRYDGAGAVAAALLRDHGVLTHKAAAHPPEILEAARYAYGGGRIEAVRQGVLDDGEVFVSDINSAYPTHIRNLPCLADGHGHWRHTRGKGTPLAPRRLRIPRAHFAVYRVRWSLADARFYPFFYREHDGTILFPREGENWVWAPELSVAIEHMSDKDEIEILESYAWQPSCDCGPPFNWIDELYAQRVAFKAMLERGDPAGRAEVPIKLGMNSLYGKMAQQLGATNHAPRFHDLCWAGYVTSSTRAQMYDAGMQSPADVIAFATDAVIGTKRLEVPEGKALGQWGVQHYGGIVMVQPGVYFLRVFGERWANVRSDDVGADETDKAAKEAKYRGFDRGTLVRDEIVRAWREGCDDLECDRHGEHDHYHAVCTRFVGAGSALASPAWYHLWRTWRTEPRRLSLVPSGKRRHDPRVPVRRYAERLVPTLPQINRAPSIISAPYSLAWLDGTALAKLEIEGVDVRVVENEWVDSWN